MVTAGMDASLGIESLNLQKFDYNADEKARVVGGRSDTPRIARKNAFVPKLGLRGG